MTFDEARWSLLVMAEERTGYLVRQQMLRARAEEDARWQAVVGATDGAG